MRLPRSRIGRVLAAVFAVLVVTSTGLAAAVTSGVISVERPTVEGVESDWGEVTNDTTEIRTNVTVDNPNRVGVPGVVGIDYDVRMNDVTVATGKNGGIGLPAGETTLGLTTRMDNDRIADWWATHVNDGERTTVSVRPTVKVGPVSRSVAPTERTFSTDILGRFNTEADREVTFDGEPFLSVTRTRASWGEATPEKTPLTLSASIHNPNDDPIVLSKIGYAVAMNDVTLTENATAGSLRIGPGATEPLRIRSTLDNSKLDEWWASHVEKGETTRLDVRVFATVEDDGRTRRIPLDFLSRSVQFRTDVMGGGETTTQEIDAGDGGEFAFERPTVESTTNDWEVTAGGDSRIHTRVVVDNPNGPESTLADVLSLDAGYSVDVNDVTLASQSKSDRELDTGRNVLEFTSTVGDERIQSWWATHINGGERTTRTLDRSVTADLGFVRYPVDLPDRTRTFTTDVLGPAGTGGEETVTVRGSTIATVHDADASWGEATTERTPLHAAVEVTNERSESMTITEIGHRVTMGGVVLADDATDRSVAISGGTTKTVRDTASLDNSQLGDWWTTHLKNGERSTVDVSYYVVVEYRGEQKRIGLDALSYTDAFETDVVTGDGEQ